MIVILNNFVKARIFPVTGRELQSGNATAIHLLDLVKLSNTTPTQSVWIKIMNLKISTLN